MDRFELLTGFGVQAPGGHKISIRAARATQRQVNQPARGQRPGRPDRVAGPLQHVDRAAQVVQRRRIPAERPQRHAAPVQYPARQHAAGQLHRAVEGGQCAGVRPA